MAPHPGFAQSPFHNTLRIHAHAKLNLYLKVLRKRKDGYHAIQTLFERIDLHDTLWLQSLPEKRIILTTDSNELSSDVSNLVYRSALLLQEKLHINKGVKIKLAKRIPIGSGMGGGSSDAASTLVGLNKLWKLKLSPKELMSFASALGSDVAFFIQNEPFALGEGRGEKITPLTALRQAALWHVLAVPRINVSTRLVYQNWDALSELTRGQSGVTLLLSALKNSDAGLLSHSLYNSLESVTMQLYPQVARVKLCLARLGVEAILMSGSGATVFGIVSSRKDALKVCRQLKSAHPQWRIFAVKTI
jgi:4-diphosphocytidyl-2-C-methyl-D-erythritol kinase